MTRKLTVNNFNSESLTAVTSNFTHKERVELTIFCSELMLSHSDCIYLDPAIKASRKWMRYVKRESDSAFFFHLASLSDVHVCKNMCISVASHAAAKWECVNAAINCSEVDSHHCVLIIDKINDIETNYRNILFKKYEKYIDRKCFDILLNKRLIK